MSNKIPKSYVRSITKKFDERMKRIESRGPANIMHRWEDGPAYIHDEVDPNIDIPLTLED